MVLVQNCPFFRLSFLGNKGQENVFYDILERKNTFLGYTKRSSKSQKIDIFPKGLSHGFCPKMAIFPTFKGEAILARKMSFTIFQNEKTPFQAIKKNVRKVKKLTFFQRGYTMVLVQKCPFFQLFLGNIGQENVFYDILERQNAILGYKNKEFKKSKN